MIPRRDPQSHSLTATHLSEQKLKKSKGYTHSAPPPAGPIALNADIPVIEMPLAAPL